ncbi:hypothetical protein [Rhodococcus rhodochrous]|nr:hypothetical protein [Rhodococcus rhodochrous]
MTIELAGTSGIQLAAEKGMQTRSLLEAHSDTHFGTLAFQAVLIPQ